MLEKHMIITQSLMVARFLSMKASKYSVLKEYTKQKVLRKRIQVIFRKVL